MRSRLPEMMLVVLPTYASGLEAPLPPAPRFRLKAKGLRPRVRRLEKVLSIGNWLYESVRAIEKNWRTEVLAEKTPYDPNEARSILDFYRQWAIPCRRCLEEIGSLQSKGASIEGAGDFERYRDQAADILAGDNPFFDDAERAGRWAAITARHRATCRPVRVDEDGRLFEMEGERFNMPGLTPADILEAIDDERAGRLRPLREVIASRHPHGL